MVLTSAYSADGALEGSVEVDITGGGFVVVRITCRIAEELEEIDGEDWGKFVGLCSENGDNAVKSGEVVVTI
jgi:hypothetical protein